QGRADDDAGRKDIALDTGAKQVDRLLRGDRSRGDRPGSDRMVPGWLRLGDEGGRGDRFSVRRRRPEACRLDGPAPARRLDPGGLQGVAQTGDAWIVWEWRCVGDGRPRPPPAPKRRSVRV